MKQLATSYTFNSTAKTVTLNGVNVPESQILLITGKGKLLYSFADGIGSAGYTQGTNSVITLQNSKGLINSDSLTIFYDDGLTDQQSVVQGNLTNRSGTITTANTSQQIIAANTNRRYLLIQNHSDSIIYIAFGVTATTSNGIGLTPGGGSLIYENGFIPTQAINAICTRSNSDFVAWEG
jgi:hypothetical protein